MADSTASPDVVALADEFFRNRYPLGTAHMQRILAGGALRADVEAVVGWEQIVNPMHLSALYGRGTSDAEARVLVALAGAAS